MFTKQIQTQTLALFMVVFIFINTLGTALTINNKILITGNLDLTNYKNYLFQKQSFGFKIIYTYSGSWEEALKSGLNPLIERDSNRSQLRLCYVYSLNDAVNKIIELGPEIERQSIIQGVPKECIAAVLFREIMFLQWGDRFIDQFERENTIGISQISVAGVRFNDRVVAEKEGGSQLFSAYSDESVFKMLQNEKDNVQFAALALKRCSYSTGKPINSSDKNDLEVIFMNYNQNPGPSGLLKSICKNPVLKIPYYSMGEYGEQTYRYYLEFKEYYEKV